MAKKRAFDFGDGEIGFECPGCGYGHSVSTEKPNPFGAQWTFNGNFYRPTFSPSIFVNREGGGGYPKCHSFVRDGRIIFCADSTHELAGQTVDLPEIDYS